MGRILRVLVCICGIALCLPAHAAPEVGGAITTRSATRTLVGAWTIQGAGLAAEPALFAARGLNPAAERAATVGVSVSHAVGGATALVGLARQRRALGIKRTGMMEHLARGMFVANMVTQTVRIGMLGEDDTEINRRRSTWFIAASAGLSAGTMGLVGAAQKSMLQSTGRHMPRGTQARGPGRRRISLNVQPKVSFDMATKSVNGGGVSFAGLF